MPRTVCTTHSLLARHLVIPSAHRPSELDRKGAQPLPCRYPRLTFSDGRLTPRANTMLSPLPTEKNETYIMPSTLSNGWATHLLNWRTADGSRDGSERRENVLRELPRADAQYHRHQDDPHVYPEPYGRPKQLQHRRFFGFPLRESNSSIFFLERILTPQTIDKFIVLRRRYEALANLIDRIRRVFWGRGSVSGWASPWHAARTR